MKKLFNFNQFLAIFALSLGFGVGVFAFSGPPVGCTPSSCTNGPLASLSAVNIGKNISIAGVTGSNTYGVHPCTSNSANLCETISLGGEAVDFFFGNTESRSTSSLTCYTSSDYYYQSAGWVAYTTTMPANSMVYFGANTNICTIEQQVSGKTFGAGTLTGWNGGALANFVDTSTMTVDEGVCSSGTITKLAPYHFSKGGTSDISVAAVNAMISKGQLKLSQGILVLCST